MVFYALLKATCSPLSQGLYVHLAWGEDKNMNEPQGAKEIETSVSQELEDGGGHLAFSHLATSPSILCAKDFGYSLLPQLWGISTQPAKI